MVIGYEYDTMGMLNPSEKICLNVSEMAIAGLYHRNVNGVELVRNVLVENDRNMMENVRKSTQS